jgi:hypothetical protein
MKYVRVDITTSYKAKVSKKGTFEAKGLVYPDHKDLTIKATMAGPGGLASGGKVVRKREKWHFVIKKLNAKVPYILAVEASLPDGSADRNKRMIRQRGGKGAKAKKHKN